MLKANALALISLLVFALTNQGHAQDLRTDLNPLQLADTSSPRETLRSFLNLSRQAIETWRVKGSDDDLYVLLQGLKETFDFSATVNGAQNLEQVRRIMFMREVLDRIELPPLSSVPGQQEVNEGLDNWRLPGTRLRIERIDEGHRRGEFVFSAQSVGDLHLTYAQIRQQPYQPEEVDPNDCTGVGRI